MRRPLCPTVLFLAAVLLAPAAAARAEPPTFPGLVEQYRACAKQVDPELDQNPGGDWKEKDAFLGKIADGTISKHPETFRPLGEFYALAQFRFPNSPPDCGWLFHNMSPAIEAARKAMETEARRGEEAEAPRAFCTMKEFEDNFMGTADISWRKGDAAAYRNMAEEVIARKIAERKPSEPFEITWGDVFELRARFLARSCAVSDKSDCPAALLDYVGYGIFQNKAGRFVFGKGVAAFGPPGFIVLAAWNVTEKTFQCRIDKIGMLVQAGATVALFIPWCKAPGGHELCVHLEAPQRLVGSKVVRAAGETVENAFGDKVRAATATPVGHGVEFVLDKAADKGKDFVKDTAFEHARGAAADMGLASDPDAPAPVPR